MIKNIINLEKPSLTIEDVLLTRFDVAKLLSISLVTLHNHNIRGILKPTHKIGRKPLYLKSYVLNQIQLSNYKIPA